MSMLLLFLNSLLSETKDHVMGFISLDDGSQEMFIKPIKPFKKIESAYLMEKTKSNDPSDYVNIKDLKSSTRFIKNNKEYDEFVQMRRKIKPEDYDYSKVKNREFEMIFITLNKIPKDGNKLYTINLTLNPKQDVNTRSFRYYKDEKRWRFDDKLDNSWSYGNVAWIVLGSFSLLIVGFLLYSFL